MLARTLLKDLRRINIWQQLFFNPQFTPGVTYLLRDEFYTARAAGSVHGTPAEPGPGTRTVVDTGSDLLITAGALTLTGGTGAYGDPGLWLDTAVARATGLACSVRFQKDAVTQHIRFGLDTDKLTSPNLGAYISTLNLFAPANELTLSVYCSGITAATWYTVALILRPNGCFTIVKGGTQFPNWTLIWVSEDGNNASFYPCISNYETESLIDHIRLAQLGPPWNALYGNAKIIATFTAVNGTAISSLTNEVGAQWKHDAGIWDVQGNAARGNPTQGAELATGNLVVGTWYIITATEVNHFYTGCAINDTFRATAPTALDANNKVKPLTLSELFATVPYSAISDLICYANLTVTAGTQAGVVICLDDEGAPANFLIAYHNGTNAVLEKCVAGTYTTLVSVAAAYVADKTIAVIKHGTSVTLYYNYVLIGTTQTVSDAGIISNTKHGIFSTYVDNRIDYFRVFPRHLAGAALAAINRCNL
jgi:hypothetical protein